MDAAHKLSKITALFLALALMAIAPWHAQAQTFSTTTQSLTLSSTGSQSLTIAGTGDSASPTNPVTFSYSIAYSGDPAWISLNNGCAASGAGGVTPVTMSFAVGCFAGQLSPNTTHTATVTLTAAAPATGTEVISVSYYSGAAGTQSLVPSTSTVAISAAVGGTGLGSFSLSTNAAVPVSYNIAENPSVSWLTFTGNQSATVSAGNPVTVGLQASAGSMTAGTYSTSLQIGYNGTTLNVSVNFAVGSGTSNGTLSFGQSSFSFSYTSGGTLPNGQSTTITNSSASTYTFSVNASPTTWLAVNGQVPNNGTVSSPILIGTAISLQPNSFATSLGTGSYTAIVTVTDSNNNTGTITVNLSVNGGSSGLTVSPNPITLSASSNSSLVQVNVSVTSTVSGTLTATVTGSGLSIPAGGGTSQTVTAGVAATVIVQGNPSGLSGTYTGSLVLQVNTSAISQSYSVTFSVGGGGCTGCTSGSSAVAAPTSLNFYYEIGQNATAGQLSQQITIAGPGNFSLGTGQPTENNDTGVAWLNAAQPIQGSPGALVTISVSPTLSAGPLTAGTYTGYYTLTFPSTGATQQINVTLTVANSAGLVANPGVVNVNCNQCSSPQPTQFIQVVATDGSSLPISVSASSTGGWLTASVSSTGGSTPTSIQYQVTPGSLSNGLYTGAIAVTSGALTLNIPVVLYIQGSNTSGGGNLTLSTSSLTFNAQVNGSAPGSQNLSVTAGSTTNFSASATVSTTSNGIQWLSITPSGNLNTNQTLVVSVAQTGLPVGTYSGTISLASGGITQSVAVTLNVSTTGTGSGGNVTVTPSSLTNFTYQIGSTVPSSQTLNVASASGSAGIGFTAAANSTGGNWLVVSPTSGNTPASLTVSLGASVLSALAAGSYTGNIVITPSGGTVLTLPVSLTVMSAPTVSATPASLSFSYQSGGSTPSPGSITVSGSASGLSFTATSAVSGSGSWLSISPASGTTPGTVAVTVNPTGLAAGSYNGTVTVSGSGTAIGSTTVTVTLTVTAPLPTITAVVNAASFTGGSQVSPGEIVSIGGTALGPTAGVSLALDSSGKVSTSIGGVTVLFNGFAAPLIYVSATQINCIAPYEIAGSISPYVQVKYLGQTSNAWSLQSAVAAPAIFTANAGGTGPGAILNPDGSFNSQKAAPKGGEIAVFMTGEGQTSPPGVTGKVTTANLPAPQVTPAPLLPVSAMIGGQPALVVYDGEAPGLVSGVLQVNVVIPATAASGNLPITISVGTASSQQGVTVAVQ